MGGVHNTGYKTINLGCLSEVVNYVYRLLTHSLEYMIPMMEAGFVRNVQVAVVHTHPVSSRLRSAWSILGFAS